MGGGSWDSRLYASSAHTRKVKGIKDFGYDDDLRTTTPYDQWKPHDDLDPKGILNSVNKVRESRDSAEHPNSVGIIVFFDVTGSMGEVPQIFQKSLSKLMSFIIMKSGIEHPQIMVGGIGDFNSDRIPLQVSQFESDNRVDEHLRKIVLEGGGGGQVHESYALGIYTAARLTAMDCYEKRGKKGYLFISGDEMPYEKISREELKKVFGITSEAEVTLQEIFDEVKEKFHVYFILPTKGTTYFNDKRIPTAWKKYVDENFLRLEEPSAICELIAATIAINEGANLDDVVKDLIDVGASKSAADAASKALATLGGDGDKTTKKIVKATAKVTEGDIPVATAGDSVKRL